MAPKCLEMGLEKLEIGRSLETIQTTTLLRSARILKRDLRKLVITQTPVKDHQQTLVGENILFSFYCRMASSKKENHKDLPREPKKFAVVIAIVVGALETVSNCLERRLEEQKIRGRIGII